MSVHLIECAAEVQLPPALKLALLCFADSGSHEGRIAKPGLDNLMRWTGLQRSRALEVVKHLTELQLLASHRPAHRGQRAEYIVFPNGCCERHGKVSATVLSVVGDDGDGPLTSADSKGSGTADPFSTAAQSTGSATSDPVVGNGSDVDDGKGPIETPERVRSPRSNREPSKYLPPKATSPDSHQHPPLTSSDQVQPVALRFGAADEPPTGIRIRTASGTPLGCPSCDAGWVCDAAGLPIAKCPHCHPASRSNGATA